MRQTHYFQRYSQRENVVTNNTLLLLQRLHEFHPRLFENVINSILELQKQELRIGPAFNQQLGGGNSVADGSITQQGFAIHIETKLHDDYRHNQLVNHAIELDKLEGKRILIGLAQKTLSLSELIEIRQKISQATGKDIAFIAITYTQLIDAIRDGLRDADYEFAEILDDYELYSQEQKLVDYKPYVMLAVAVGDTIIQNKDYNVYYDPRSRSHRPFTYLGLYKQKAIHAIGKLINTVDADLINDELHIIDSSHPVNDDQKQRIKECMREAIHKPVQGCTFYLVDNFETVDFRKKQGFVVSKKYLYFEDGDYGKFEVGMSAAELANLLQGELWD